MSLADSINGFKKTYVEYKDNEVCPFDKTVGNTGKNPDFIDFSTNSFKNIKQENSYKAQISDIKDSEYEYLNNNDEENSCTFDSEF